MTVTFRYLSDDSKEYLGSLDFPDGTHDERVQAVFDLWLYAVARGDNARPKPGDYEGEWWVEEPAG